MRQLHLLLMAFFFLFTVQVHAAKEIKKASAAKTTVSAATKNQQTQKKRLSLNDAEAFRISGTFVPKANYGDSKSSTSCPYKNASMSPFSREGKLTQVQRMLPGNAYNYRSSTSTN